ncbi:MAG: VWA domain-containing protein, partial [Bdellovibrionales bacterium]|nr:VWA domain-containing protein [Bdellovibrionales bacterium]
MQFANTHLLWMLIAIPLLYALGRHQLKQREAALKVLAEPTLLEQLVRGAPEAKRQRRLRPALVTLSGALLLFALLRPQWGFEWKEGARQGVDIILALDVSQSMLAADLAPNRLTRAKREVVDLLNSLRGDRVGLVSFAGTAYVESPLTLDYGAFKVFLGSLRPELLPVPGTNIEGAIVESIRAFERGAPARGADGKVRSRALILITDGEDFEGNFDHAAELAEEASVQIYVYGIGTAEGAPIPAENGYKRDKEGRVVISKLNEGALQQLAADTGGLY